MRFVPAILLGFMLAEIAVFVWIGSLIGALSVVMLVVLGGIAGSALIRREGLKTLKRLRTSMDHRGELNPAGEARLFPVAAGFLLMIPGFISDIIAILLLLPPVQRFLVAKVTSWFGKWGMVQPPGGPVIEAEAIEIPEPPERRLPTGKASPWRQ